MRSAFLTHSQRRFALRAATSASHRDVETTVTTGDWFANAAGYGRFLRATLSAREPLERRASDLISDGDDRSWRPFLVCDAVRADLADLGHRQVPLPPLESHLDDRVPEPFLWGVTYVLAGSCLGARILCRRVGVLGLTADHGARHLFAQAAAAELWPGLVRALEANVWSESDERVCSSRAQFAFERMRRALEAARRE